MMTALAFSTAFTDRLLFVAKTAYHNASWACEL